jgi:hypothetical protein
MTRVKEAIHEKQTYFLVVPAPDAPDFRPVQAALPPNQLSTPVRRRDSFAQNAQTRHDA